MAAEICFQRYIEQLDVDLPHVVTHPFLEDIDQKAAVLLAADRTLGDEIAGLRVEQTFPPGRSLQPWLAISSVSSVARSTIGMNCTHFAPSSSRKKR